MGQLLVFLQIIIFGGCKTAVSTWNKNREEVEKDLPAHYWPQDFSVT